MKLPFPAMRFHLAMRVMVALVAAQTSAESALAQNPVVVETSPLIFQPPLSTVQEKQTEVDRLGMIEEGYEQQDASNFTSDPAIIRPSGIPYPVPHGPCQTQLDPYRQRAESLSINPALSIDGLPNGEAVEFDVWWEPAVTAPLGLAGEVISVDVAGLTQTALSLSPYVRGALTEPQIRQNDLVIESAAFDSLAFIEGKFADTNDPVGSALTTGDNSTRFRDDTFSSSAGLRKKSVSGGSWELAQRGGFQSNNSTFLIPNPQGTTRLEINYTQPLMRDRGRAVNQTRIVLAQIDVKLATNEVRQDLENHLTEVTRAYWTLFQARAEWLQRQRLYDRAVELHEILKARGAVDSHQRQILRAEAAVASRQSSLIRTETRIRNAQARLRLLTGDPQLIQSSQWELIPLDLPLGLPVELSQRDATITALDNRADISEAIRKIQATSVRVGAAKNQVLPRLDMILHTHVAGLDANRDTFGAFAKQFSEGGPSYAAGLLYEVPIGNRAAEARLARNRWEMTREIYQFQQTTEEAFTDVEIAVRETRTAYAEMVAKKQSINAAAREVDYLKQRWELMPDPNDSAVLLIEDLLDAQERLADEERALVTAQVGYALSWVQLRKSMGILLRLDNPNAPPTISFDSRNGEPMR